MKLVHHAIFTGGLKNSNNERCTVIIINLQINTTAKYEQNTCTCK